MIKAFLGLLLLITISHQARLKAKQSTIETPFPVPTDWNPQFRAKTSRLVFIFDDVVTKIWVNYNLQPLQFSEEAAKTVLLSKRMNLNLRKGDIVSVTGYNLRQFNGFLGYIAFNDENGKETVYLTGADWTCDGKPALVLGPNDGKLTDRSPITSIPREAHLIYAQGTIPLYQEVTCSFMIPK